MKYTLILSLEKGNLVVEDVLIIEDLTNHYKQSFMTYKVVNAKGKELNTDISLHPGEILEMELEARGLKKTEFAHALGMRPGHFGELLHGKRHVGAYIAYRQGAQV